MARDPWNKSEVFVVVNVLLLLCLARLIVCIIHPVDWPCGYNVISAFLTTVFHSNVIFFRKLTFSPAKNFLENSEFILFKFN